jgi:PAS domain S-box-containing protein
LPLRRRSGHSGQRWDAAVEHPHQSTVEDDKCSKRRFQPPRRPRLRQRGIWIQDTFKVIYDNHGKPVELVGAWADISERRRAEQKALKANAELQETKRSLSRLIESSPNAIIATDRNGAVTLFNQGAETLLSYRAEEVVGRSVAPLYGGEAGINEVLRKMEKGGTVSGLDSLLWAKDGTSIPVLISASLLYDDDGRQIGTVGFAT